MMATSAIVNSRLVVPFRGVTYIFDVLPDEMIQCRLESSQTTKLLVCIQSSKLLSSHKYRQRLCPAHGEFL